MDKVIRIIRTHFFLIGDDDKISINTYYEDGELELLIDTITHNYVCRNDHVLSKYGFVDDDSYIGSYNLLWRYSIDVEHLICVFSKLPEITEMPKELEDRWALTMELLRPYDKRVSREVITQVIAINNEYKRQIEELTSLMSTN